MITRGFFDAAPKHLASVVILSLALCGTARESSAQATERSGKEVAESLCISCHGPGANGAPKIGDRKAWATRASRGLTGLGKNALKGIRQMPPHGGNMNLTDTEVERAITYMVNQSGGHWNEPVSRASPGKPRSGKQIVAEQCTKCHRDGVGGAPKIGAKAEWTPRLTPGLDYVVRSAINGHGKMPPRGGLANLSDAEIRSAIVYMFNPASAEAKNP